METCFPTARVILESQQCLEQLSPCSAGWAQGCLSPSQKPLSIQLAFFRNVLSSFVIRKALLQWRRFGLLFLTERFIDLIYSTSFWSLYQQESGEAAVVWGTEGALWGGLE